ncbi:TRAP transporter small permease [Frigidibacter sp. MR17.14]|uniref:TRAP transporter small permease n=1 Tax=Frigidibacter sp. MR17.14 TaxID=3126509 RepID=UPI003012E1AA
MPAHIVPIAASLWMRRCSLALAALAGVSLVLMMALVFIAVVLRYAFGLPLLGVNEIVQLLSVAVVMLALPSCTAEGAHVGVDILDRRIGRWGRYAGDLLSRALSVWVISVLVGRAVLKALDAREFGDATNMLQLPIWPFYAMLAAGMALCVAILVVQALLILLQGPRDDS